MDAVDWHAVADARALEINRLRCELDLRRERPSIDQARGALSWLLSHWWGDEGDTSGDMPHEYDMAREILGAGLVDQLGQMVGNQSREAGEFDEFEVYDDDRESAEFAARASAGEIVQRDVRTTRGPWVAAGGEV